MKPIRLPENYTERMVLESLQRGPKFPFEIERDIQEKVDEAYDAPNSFNDVTQRDEIEKRKKQEYVQIAEIHRILKRLLKEGKIKQSRRYDRYSLSFKILSEPWLSGEIFSYRAMRDLDGLELRPIVQPPTSGGKDAFLYYYANVIGAYVIYCILQGFFPDGPFLCKKNQPANIRRALTKEWLENSVNGFDMLHLFKTYHQSPNLGSTNKMALELSIDDYNEWMASYRKVFAAIESRLSALLSDIEERITKYPQRDE